MNFRYNYEINSIKILILLILIPLFLKSQNLPNKIVKLGTGVSLIGSGDLGFHHFDLEYYKSLNRYFSISTSLTSGYGFNNYNSPAAFLIKPNLNILFSLLKNRRKFNIEIGGGLALQYVSAKKVTRRKFINGQLVEIQYRNDNYQSIGYNLMLENSYRINPNHMVAIRAFITPYFNTDRFTTFFTNDIHSGIQISWGFMLKE